MLFRSHEQVFTRLAKKYPDVKPPETELEIMAAKKTSGASKKRTNTGLPILERITQVENRLHELEKSILKMEKKMEQKEGSPSEIKQELKRLKKLIEG